jgi:hypothetical protein
MSEVEVKAAMVGKSRIGPRLTKTGHSSGLFLCRILAVRPGQFARGEAIAGVTDPLSSLSLLLHSGKVTGTVSVAILESSSGSNGRNPAGSEAVFVPLEIPQSINLSDAIRQMKQAGITMTARCQDFANR